MAFLRNCFGRSDSTCKKQPSATIEDLCHRFSLAQLRKSTNNFDESRIISRQAGGVVYRGCISIDGELRDIALKRTYQFVESTSFKQEIIFMCQLQHPNLVSLVGFCDDENELITVYDYAPNISLYHQLYQRESNSPTLSWKRRIEISIGVARVLHYLHSGTKQTIIHLDVRPKAILLDENWVPKLKFNGAAVKGPKFSETHARPVEPNGFVGTFGYVAPEIYMLPGPNVTDKCDVYSFGVVLFELICGKPPSEINCEHGNFPQLRDLAETKNFDQRAAGEIAQECAELYMEIIRSCFSEDPKERPHMGEVELQLERVLQLQEEADANRASHAFLF